VSEAITARIIDRINKLLALAGNNSSEAEAASAAAKAQSLMEEYNIEVSTLEAGGSEKESREKTMRHDLSAMYEWQRDLMTAIADSNMCHYRTVKTDTFKDGRPVVSKRHRLVGRKANVAVAIQMYEYLVGTMSRLLPYSNKDSLSKSAHSWREGCVDRLRSRLTEQRREAVKASRAKAAEERARQTAAASHPGSPPGTGLVLSLGDVIQDELDLNLDFLYGYEPGTMKANRAKWRAEASAEASSRPAPAPAKPLTEAEQAKIEAANRRYWERAEARSRREAAKTDWVAYERGAKAGAEIGLNPQVKSNPAKQIG
jgi:hypothetical protein